MTDHIYFGRVIQDGQPVAQVSSADFGSMLRELRRYAIDYAMYGPVKVQMREKGRRWKVMYNG